MRRRFDELRSVGSVIAVLDEISAPADLGRILLPLAGAMRSLAPGARVVTISRPAQGEDPARDAARGGVEGFLRSLAHEMRRGGTANGILVQDGVDLDAPGVTGALRFLLSARSAFVTGQFLTVSSAAGSLTENRAGRSPGAPLWSPAPLAASVRRSPARSRPTAPGSWCSTYPAQAPSSRSWPTSCARSRCSSTSPPRARGSAWSPSCASALSCSTSPCSTPASPATSCSPT